MPVTNDPTEPGFITGGGTGGSETPGNIPAKLISADEINKLIADIKAHVPAMKFAYLAWLGYGQPIDSLVVQGRMELILPILQKPVDQITDDETATLVGALARIAVEGGKALSASLLPILGRDAIAILSALGMLA